jgi:hypothetical protein
LHPYWQLLYHCFGLPAVQIFVIVNNGLAIYSTVSIDCARSSRHKDTTDVSQVVSTTRIRQSDETWNRFGICNLSTFVRDLTVRQSEFHNESVNCRFLNYNAVISLLIWVNICLI